MYVIPKKWSLKCSSRWFFVLFVLQYPAWIDDHEPARNTKSNFSNLTCGQKSAPASRGPRGTIEIWRGARGSRYTSARYRIGQFVVPADPSSWSRELAAALAIGEHVYVGLPTSPSALAANWFAECSLQSWTFRNTTGIRADKSR